jgi:CRISPR-associated endonuclease/helicase Cas3
VHLQGTAHLAASFASAFDGAEAARFLGLWHDLGKFNPKFQEYLVACEANPTGRGHGPDHKAAGSLIAARYLGPAALLVHGHHGGLRAREDFNNWIAGHQNDPAVAEALELARRALPGLEPEGRIALPAWAQRDTLSAELFLRLLFSALVDADYLDTERHFHEEVSAVRGGEAGIEELCKRIERDQEERFSNVAPTAVNQARREIYAACLAAADQPPGLFRLTVPTGGGKTRSAMAFALRHALRHGLRRVIVAIPHISITEQTAQVYREIFEEIDGRPVVLEHHSEVGADESGDGEDFHARRVWGRLAAENWDAPVVVTTTVQLFESLFARGTSRCRKLHRLARSLIILDEAQALPPHLLEPILDALRQLSANYGSTVVISTATQPAFEAIPLFASVPAGDLVPDSERYFEALRRVSYEWRTETAVTWGEAAELMRKEPVALAVVNTKKDALSLLEALDDPAALHLSTLLCGAHRRDVIALVRQRLKDGSECRLVSTQVVEAGVDLDFPLVLRAVGPLDGIIQAAGRCNREGLLQRGRVIVFRPADGGMPHGSYRTAASITRSLLERGDVDPDKPELPRDYFRQLFETVETDREGIQRLRESLEYPKVAQAFRMIDEDTESVVVTQYGSEEQRGRVEQLLDDLRRGTGNRRLLFRNLQPYIVSIYKRQVERYRAQGFIVPVQPGLGEWMGEYDAVRGIVAQDTDLIV